MQDKWILASASPRRKEILEQAGIQPIIRPSDYEETESNNELMKKVIAGEALSAEESLLYARSLSVGKAKQIYTKWKEEQGKSGMQAMNHSDRVKDDPKVSKENCSEAVRTFVLGADTIVVQNGHIMNKPKDRADAFRMLSELQGSVHKVITGVTMYMDYENTWKMESFAVETEVEFDPMSAEEIDSYLDLGEYADKAGAYGIQGKVAKHIKELRGDYYNVVGLPISAVYRAYKIMTEGEK